MGRVPARRPSTRRPDRTHKDKKVKNTGWKPHNHMSRTCFCCEELHAKHKHNRIAFSVVSSSWILHNVFACFVVYERGSKAVFVYLERPIPDIGEKRILYRLAVLYRGRGERTCTAQWTSTKSDEETGLRKHVSYLFWYAIASTWFK